MNNIYPLTYLFLLLLLSIPLSGQINNCPTVSFAEFYPIGADANIPGNCKFTITAEYAANGANNSSIQITLGICDAFGNITTSLETSPVLGALQTGVVYQWNSMVHSVPCDSEVCLTYSAWNGINGNGNCAANVQGPPILGELPVELIRFEASLVDDQVMLEWITATEENNDLFEVQHSTDGQQFLPIVQIDGHGTTDETQYYQYFHKSPTRGDNYYRIKQVDLDGQFTLFDMVVVKMEAPEKYTLYPSTAYHIITLESPVTVEKSTTVSIVNSTGEVMKSGLFKAGSYKIEFDVNDLPEGLYFMQFVGEDNKYTARRFVKVRY